MGHSACAAPAGSRQLTSGRPQELNTTTDALLQNGTFLEGLLAYQIVPAMSLAQLEAQLGTPVETLLPGEAIAPALSTTGVVTAQSVSAGQGAPAPAGAGMQGDLVLLGVNSDARLVQAPQPVGASYVAVTDAVLLPAIELVYDYDS